MKKGAFIEKIEKLKMIHRVLIFAGTVILVAGLFIYFIYMPKTEEIGRLKGQIAGLQQQIDKAKIAAARLPELEKEEARLEAEFRDALRLLPNQKEIPSLLKGLTKLGVDANLEFRLFSPQSERDKGFYAEIPVSMELSGTYHDVAVFFNKVSNMERIVNIHNVTMKPQKANSTTLVTKCEAVTYRFKEGANESTKQEPKKAKHR
ncbi:MAG: type 4a pilus biogenesis protein PilO [Deltaproteobacteria bacterium]|nr:type 4a pilus biogenesis protein PilO [Deltaproteobacteria bacterium]MBW1818434.1 type 4a pilus biogenesis protein PilO [Deltaproteobacteria bacterium]MBW2283534.1 type 4a pilus biogenesis protein PilO [Deltaproteobacteria bacterium]